MRTNVRQQNTEKEGKYGTREKKKRKRGEEKGKEKDETVKAV